jgi:lipopolysaccharide export system permease protein
MKVLTKYVLKAIIGPLFFGIFAFSSLFLGMQFINLIRMAQEYHLSLAYILKILVLMIPENVTIGASISVLLAILLGIGNLTSHSETIAMRAGGLSYSNLAIPILIMGLTVSTIGVLLNQYLVPISIRTYQQMRAEAASKEASGIIYQFNKIFQEKDEQKLIYADRYEPKNKEFHNVVIQELLQGKLRRTISASVMYWSANEWYFKQALIYQYTTDSLFPITIDKGKVNYKLNLTPAEVEQFNEEPEKQSISELNSYIKKFTKGIERQRLLVDLHTKLSIPFASLVFAILGTPLALRPQRRTNAAGFGLCIIFIVVWYVLLGLGSSLARAGSIPAFVGAWLPNIVLAGYGLYVFFKVKS